MREASLGASVSQDRVNVSADEESMLVTTAVAMQKISFIMAIDEEHTTAQCNKHYKPSLHANSNKVILYNIKYYKVNKENAGKHVLSSS